MIFETGQHPTDFFDRADKRYIQVTYEGLEELKTAVEFIYKLAREDRVEMVDPVWSTHLIAGLTMLLVEFTLEPRVLFENFKLPVYKPNSLAESVWKLNDLKG